MKYVCGAESGGVMHVYVCAESGRHVQLMDQLRTDVMQIGLRLHGIGCVQQINAGASRKG